MRTHYAEDVNRLKLIEELKKAAKEKEAAVWDKIAEELSRSRRNRRCVNVWKINRYTEKGDIALIPGKVMGDGILDHKVEVAAFKFTENAKQKIKSYGGKTISIPELLKKNPKGSKIKIIS
ncbi:MAG: 50S ribosomal protein L18e [Candidatus Altiarchaeales archaeon ex4484_96]|nr:MAG: 50S ribosomal protein L18e [Candidatus Altiarchaeales archaeon ex4484_96]